MKKYNLFYLINSGGDEMTPVHIAAIEGNTSLLRCLLDARGDPLLCSKMGNALKLATMNNHTETVDLISRFLSHQKKIGNAPKYESTANVLLSTKPKLDETDRTTSLPNMNIINNKKSTTDSMSLTRSSERTYSIASRGGKEEYYTHK